MSLTDIDIAVATEKRLGWDASKRLTLMSYIPAAMSNLAKQVARDPSKRNLLMTDPDTVSVTVTPGVRDSVGTSATTGTADLSTIVDTYDIMLDCLKYGTIYHQYQISFTSTDVTTGTWPSGGYVEIQGAGFILTDALPVYLETAGALPGGISADVTYYIIATEPDYAFATSAANAAVPTGITLTAGASGTSTIYSTPKQVLQWLQSPNQGLAVSCLPFDMLQGWLVGYDLHVKGIPFQSTHSKLQFAVPYTPNPSNFPEDESLYEDLLDCMVGLATTGGVEDVPPNS
jgi:hypothetical protein